MTNSVYVLVCTIFLIEFYLLYFQVAKKIFVKEDSAGEKGTSFAEMNRTESSNAKKGPSVDYNSFKDFFHSETIAHILVAWMHFAGMQSTDGTVCILHFNFMNIDLV